MRFEPLFIAGVWQIHLTPQLDARGSFTRTFDKEMFAAQGLESNFVQHGTSTNIARGTLRGMHFQDVPHAEVKLVRCARGKIQDVVLDLRPESPTYLQHVSVVLDAATPSVIYVPKGCAHGFLTLVEDCTVEYQISTAYIAQAQRGARWDDAAFAIRWMDEVHVISERDRAFADWRQL